MTLQPPLPPPHHHHQSGVRLSHQIGLMSQPLIAGILWNGEIILEDCSSITVYITDLPAWFLKELGCMQLIVQYYDIRVIVQLRECNIKHFICNNL